MIGTSSLRTPLAVLAATACVTGVALTVSDQARSVVDMAPIGVWFANDDADSVSHVGPAGTDATVQIVRPTGTMRITELDGVAYVADEDGRLSRIDPAHLVVSQEAVLPSADSQLIGGGGRLYVVDRSAGTVRELDPEGLTTIGETARLGAELGDAVVDDDGVLWVPDLSTGAVVAVDGRAVTGTSQIARPGDDLTLSVVNGIVVALNPTASTVTEVAGGTRAGTTHQVPVTAGATAPTVVGGASVLPVVSGTELVTLDLRNGRSIRIELTDRDHRLGTPALAGDRVYVPDFTAGTLLVVDLASKRVVDTLRVTGKAGSFELVVEGGRVFVNDPGSERAWTINASGALVPVAKYDPSRPGNGTGGGVVPPPATTTTTLPQRNDDRDDSDEEDDDEEDTPPPSSTPSSTPRGGANATPPTPPVATAPVLVVPPSTTKPEPPVVTVPGAGGAGTTGPGATTTTSEAPALSDGAVRELVAVPGDGAVTVSWRPPDGWRAVTGYRVVVEPSGGAFDVNAGETSFTASGLRNGTAYVFRVTARSADGDGATVSSGPVTPSAPRRGRITGYVVEVFGGSGAAPGQVGADQRSITVTGLTNGTSYYATVRAAADGQLGAPTSTATFVPGGVPGRPGGVSAAVTAGGQVTVTWSAAPANGRTVTGYTVSAPGLARQPVGADTLVAVFDGLTVGATHTFTVVATNELGDGPGASSAAVVVQSQVPGPPGAVTARAGDGTATVTWTAAASNGSTIDGYRVSNVTDGTAATFVPAGATSQTFRSLSNGTAYVFEVQAVATNGAAGQPVQTNAVTPVGPMLAPTNVVATVTSPVSITVTFDAPATSNGNPVQGWVVSTTPATSEQTVTAGSATISGLTQGVTYTVNVAAVSPTAGRGPAAASAAVTTPTGLPQAVTNLRVVAEGINGITLAWDAMPYAEWYRIEPNDGVTAAFDVTANTATWNPPNVYDAIWQPTVTAWSSWGAAAASSVYVYMPSDPRFECGGPRQQICP